MNWKFLTAGILTVLGIALIANVIGGQVAIVDTSLPLEGDAQLEIGQQENLGIEYGSLAELYRFSLKAAAIYSLRDVSFSVDASGLNFSDWKIYEMKNGAIDYSHVVATEEDRHDDLLHMRFASDPGVAFLGTEKTHSFVLVARVERVEGEPSLSIGLLAEPAAWVNGHFQDPWLKVDGEKVNNSITSS